MDNFPAKILFEAERRYGKKLLHENVNKMSVLWHSSSANPCYHYTLRAYNPVGWMAVTIEMEATNQGKVYMYYPQDWSRWMVHWGGVHAKHFFQLGDHIEMRLRHVYYILKAQNIRKSPSSWDGKIVVLDMGRALLVNKNIEFLDQVVTGIYLVQRLPHSNLFLTMGDYTIEGNSFTLQSRKDKEQYDILSGIHRTLVYKTLYDDTTQTWSIRTVTAPFIIVYAKLYITLSLPRKDLICHPPNATIHPYVFKVPARTLLGVLPVMGRHNYACQHNYTTEQHEWMSQQGILFERAVQDNHVLIFFTRLFEDWFDQWPITDDRSDTAVEQLKVEISTLYIMGLKNQWVVHGLCPERWTEEYVIDKLDYLEDIVVILWELQQVFVVELLDNTGN
ncbi:hypothetical protein IW261DRAFT_1421273 [Armillaria novae-zelandiae]|uniref:Uncharacterized protein n=1 Tax=Armillaria novae-zelandiae TaxID=153914 RepID=A0AA39P533_9AGAR|nr:hypothetical protein IW261DRAFT_1421273 [Armillaria novae-zelandiae]